MIVAANDRLYNLATFGLMESGGQGAVRLHLTGGQLTVAFAGTSGANPINANALVELIGEATLGDGIFTWEEFEGLYHAAIAKLERRKLIREAMNSDWLAKDPTSLGGR